MIEKLAVCSQKSMITCCENCLWKNLASLEIFKLEKLQFLGHHFVCSVPRAKNKICRTETHKHIFHELSSFWCNTEEHLCNSDSTNFQLYVNEELYIRYLSVKLIQLLAHPSSKPLHWCNQIPYSDAWILDVTFSLKALHQILLKLPLVFI